MKKYPKKTVSIYLPAYNEQGNINNILKQIFIQKQKGFLIKDVVVVSDGSTDNTVKIAKRYLNKGLKVINGKINRGQTYRQNEILSFCTSDILVLLNADLLLADREVISRLIAPILAGADLSAQWAFPFKPKTFIEKILYAGFELKHFIYQKHKNGNNIYTCVGHMRALSKEFYRKVRFPKVSDGEDQYLYLACVKGGYHYEYAHGCNLYFKLPQTFEDYKKYAIRIFQTQTKFGDIFSEELVRTERKIPIILKIQGVLHALSKCPLYTFPYIALHALMQQWALHHPANTCSKFETSPSTKNFSMEELQ